MPPHEIPVMPMLEEMGITGIETANDGEQATEALKNALTALLFSIL